MGPIWYRMVELLSIPEGLSIPIVIKLLLRKPSIKESIIKDSLVVIRRLISCNEKVYYVAFEIHQNLILYFEF